MKKIIHTVAMEKAPKRNSHFKVSLTLSRLSGLVECQQYRVKILLLEDSAFELGREKVQDQEQFVVYRK